MGADPLPLPPSLSKTCNKTNNKGIVHRDVKLENCLLDDQQRLKLADFGLGNFANEMLMTSCGSVGDDDFSMRALLLLFEMLVCVMCA